MARGGSVKRTRDARVRLTSEEHAAWSAARERAGAGELGAWVRQVVNAVIGEPGAPERLRPMRSDRRPAVPASEREIAVDEAAYRALVRAGNNLNQLARWANTEGRYPAEAEASAVFEQVRVAVAEVRAAILLVEARARRRGRS